MTSRGTMPASVGREGAMMHGYQRGELQRAWRAVATRYAARCTGLAVEPWQSYTGSIDVQAIADAAELPRHDRDHARAWRVLRANFELRFAVSLFTDESAA